MVVGSERGASCSASIAVRMAVIGVRSWWEASAEKDRSRSMAVPIRCPAAVSASPTSSSSTTPVGSTRW